MTLQPKSRGSARKKRNKTLTVHSKSGNSPRQNNQILAELNARLDTPSLNKELHSVCTSHQCLT